MLVGAKNHSEAMNIHNPETLNDLIKYGERDDALSGRRTLLVEG